MKQFYSIEIQSLKRKINLKAIMRYIVNEKGKKLFAVVPIKEWNYLQMVKKKLELLNEGHKSLNEIEK